MVVFLIVFLTFIQATISGHLGDLMDYLQEEAWGYIAELPPDVPLHVDVVVRLEEIKEINDVYETISTKIRVKMKWSDVDFGWNSTEYSDLESLILQQESIWKPDIAILNDVSSIKALGSKAFPVTVYGGKEMVFWAPMTVSVTKCDFDLEFYPYDVQKCEIKVGTVASSMEHIILGSTECQVANNVYGTGSWNYYNMEYNITTEVIDDVLHLEHQVISCTVHIKRKPFFIILNVIFPLILLGVLNSFSFLIPDESGEKVSYSITLFLTFAVFITIMMDRLPDNADKPTKIQLYLMYQLGISVLIIIICVLKLQIKQELLQNNQFCHNCHPEKGPQYKSKARNTSMERQHSGLWRKSRLRWLRRSNSTNTQRQHSRLVNRNHKSQSLDLHGSDLPCSHEENKEKKKVRNPDECIYMDENNKIDIKQAQNERPHMVCKFPNQDDTADVKDHDVNASERRATMQDFLAFWDKNTNKRTRHCRGILKVDFIGFCVVILIQIICNAWFFA